LCLLGAITDHSRVKDAVTAKCEFVWKGLRSYYFHSYDSIYITVAPNVFTRLYNKFKGASFLWGDLDVDQQSNNTPIMVIRGTDVTSHIHWCLYFEVSLCK